MISDIMYFAGVRFKVGDMTSVHGEPYIYFGEDADGYSIFLHADVSLMRLKRLIVAWHENTIIDALRLPILSKFDESEK